MLEQADREQLAAMGISADEVARQLRLFTDPPPAPQLDRAATVSDGIVALDHRARAAALDACARAVVAERVLKFVPASGAATRMFQDLMATRRAGTSSRDELEVRAGSDGAARETLKFFDNLERFAFFAALAAAAGRRGGDLAVMRRRGEVGGVLDALLEPDGLGYATAPKGLILFHRYAEASHSAFQEHLIEGQVLARGGSRSARFHFTVSPEHEAAFRAVLDRFRDVGHQRGADVQVTFSHQHPATDTIAVDADNRPFRTADGRLLFRPGGHGALIGNLDALHGDIVYIKNIDNIPAEHLRAAALECAQLLIGHLALVQDELAAHRAALDGPAVDAAQIDAARRFAARVLHEPVSSGGDVRGELCTIFDRPVRVCGMVRNTGEPGGGPFWVRDAHGTTRLQIVESAQVDPRQSEQRAIFAAATHFNPVVMACGVRDRRGRPFDLHAFVDPAAVFIAEKSKEGRALKALERPGLWNGAMARWNTIFVEVPEVTFSPVKTVNDLLRPAHQPPHVAADRAAAGER